MEYKFTSRQNMKSESLKHSTTKGRLSGVKNCSSATLRNSAKVETPESILQVRRDDKYMAVQSQASYFKGPEEGKREVDKDYTWLEQRRVKDSIYNEFISLPLPYWKYIDNPIYTRLKDLY